MEDPSQNLALQFVLLLILTLLNAFFSASEMALVSLNRSRVEQKAAEGDRRYTRLLSVLDNPNNFLSTIQVGITFIGLLQGASLSASLGSVIASWFGNFVWAQTAGSVISLVFLTYISIVLGELYPKRQGKFSGCFCPSHYLNRKNCKSVCLATLSINQSLVASDSNAI